MKALATLALVLVSGSAYAGQNVVISPAHRVRVVPITAVAAQIDTSNGWANTHVTATATFSNACTAPTADELLIAPSYSDSYGTLNLSVLENSQRVCTAEYNPVVVTLDLGKWVRPNDGTFQKILVNGVAAQAVQD